MLIRYTSKYLFSVQDIRIFFCDEIFSFDWIKITYKGVDCVFVLLEFRVKQGDATSFLTILRKVESYLTKIIIDMK